MDIVAWEALPALGMVAPIAVRHGRMMLGVVMDETTHLFTLLLPTFTQFSRSTHVITKSPDYAVSPIDQVVSLRKIRTRATKLFCLARYRHGCVG